MPEDSPAIRVAVVESRIDTHEKICAERYGEIKDSFSRVHGRLDGINSGVRSLLIAIVLALISALGFFVVPFFQRGG